MTNSKNNTTETIAETTQDKMDTNIHDTIQVFKLLDIAIYHYENILNSKENQLDFINILNFLVKIGESTIENIETTL